MPGYSNRSIQKKNQKSLALRRDLLRHLVPDELRQAAGGLITNICSASCPTMGCPPSTHTTTCPQ